MRHWDEARMPGYVIEAAAESDMPEIFALYRGAIGTEGCTWSEEYPTEDILRDDLARHALYCARTSSGEIVAAVSVDADPIVDALPNWSENHVPAHAGEKFRSAELARLAVKEGFQNRGIAREMIRFMEAELKRENSIRPPMDYVHFLVSQTNLKALRSYAKLEYDNRGEAELFGHKWWCYEKKIR